MHEFGHTDIGGAYNDTIKTSLKGPLGNLLRKSNYRVRIGMRPLPGYKDSKTGICYGLNGYPGGSC